jgi:hypothetical protein
LGLRPVVVLIIERFILSPLTYRSSAGRLVGPGLLFIVRVYWNC